jgi:hypothetical protein
MAELTINVTQFTGIAGFSLAAIFAFWVARVSTRKQFWIGIATFYVVAVFEIIFSNRHDLTNYVRAILKQYDVYSAKVSIQLALIGCVAISFGFLAYGLMRILREHENPERLASAVTFVLSGVFLTEIISLHMTDAILYQSVKGVLFIGYLWIVCSALIVFAATVRLRLERLATP